MQNKVSKRIYLFVLIILILSVFLCFLTGCQSTDKNESYLDTSRIEFATFEYDSISNQTKVMWHTSLTNDTIYKINSFSVTFYLYKESVLIKSETFNYSKAVKQGAEKSSFLNFYTDDDIDFIELVSWTANYDSLWDTYKVWFIVMIVLAGVASLIYIIIMIIADLEIYDTFDIIAEFFEEHGWVAICFLIPIVGTIWGIITSYWVPILIVLGGIISFILIALLAHLIKYIVEYILCKVSTNKDETIYDSEYEDEDYFDPTVEDIADYIDDEDILMMFSVEQLKNYCRENGIKGYSALNKANLVNLIINNSYYIDENEDDDYYDNQYEYEDYFDPTVEEVADYIDDEHILMMFSIKQLKNYCRDNGIESYSTLNKVNLVNLIVNKNKKNEIVRKRNVKKNISKKKGNTVSNDLKSNNITFNDIAGLEEAKNAFKEKVVYAFEHKELYERYGKKVGGGILLYGLPGTGKTMFAEAASNETDSLFIPIKCSDIKSKWYGESEGNIKKIFEKARKAKKAIIFFDEFEAIGRKRTDSSENLTNDLVPQILAEMQGIGSNDSNALIMVIAATNKPWIIDSAFLRPGRFDEKIYIPLPDIEARKKLFELKLKTVPQDGLDFDYLAKITDGFNGADIGAFCDKLKMLAINKSITNNADCPITMAEVTEVQGLVKSSVSNEDVESLIEFKNQYR